MISFSIKLLSVKYWVALLIEPHAIAFDGIIAIAVFILSVFIAVIVVVASIPGAVWIIVKISEFEHVAHFIDNAKHDLV